MAELLRTVRRTESHFRLLTIFGSVDFRLSKNLCCCAEISVQREEFDGWRSVTEPQREKTALIWIKNTEVTSEVISVFFIFV